jgi:hypothetical protein
MADLLRMANNPDAQLAGRASTDPGVLAEVAFRDQHGGMSRADVATRKAQWERDSFEAGATAGIDGEPPGGLVDALSGTPHHARHASSSKSALSPARQRTNSTS